MAIFQRNDVPNMGNEMVHVSLPRTWRGDGTKMCVVLAEGYPNGYEVNYNANQFRDTIKAINDAGFAVINSQFGTNAFGNDLSQTRITNAIAYMRNKHGAHPTKVSLAGFSMGSMNVLSWAGNNAEQVAYMHLWCPAPDQGYAYTSNNEFKTVMDAAYGGWSESQYGAQHNPITMANAGKYDDIPIRLEYAPDDTVTPPSFVTVFAGASGAEAVNIGTGGHTMLHCSKPETLQTLVNNLKLYS